METGLISAGLESSTRSKRIRFATFSSGVCIGEIAFLNNLPRTADLVADEDSTCLVLHRDTFEQLQHEEPDVAIDIILALHRDLARKVDRANQQLSLLEQR